MPVRLSLPPNGRYPCRRIDALESIDHSMTCPGCGATIDCRDLGQVFDHAGPLPHVAGEPGLLEPR